MHEMTKRWTKVAIGAATAALLTMSLNATALLGPVDGLLGGTTLPTAPLLGSSSAGPVLTGPTSAMAFGVWARAGDVLLVGPEPLAYATTQKGTVRDQATAVRLHVVDGAGDLLATVQGLDGIAFAHAGSSQARAGFTVANANLLGGLIQATLLRVNASSDGPGSFSTMGSTIGSLTIAGIHVDVSAVPGTGLSIPGIATVFVNETVHSGGYTAKYALRVHLLRGIDIVVGSAQVFTGATQGQGTQCLTWSEAFPLGANAVALGVDARLKHNAVMADISEGGDAKAIANDLPVRIPGILGGSLLGAVTVGHVHPDASRVRAESKVLGLSLLGGRITADLVHARAFASVNPNTQGIVATNSGSAFLNLRIDGVTVSGTAHGSVFLFVNGHAVAQVFINEETRTTTNHNGVQLAIERVNMLRIVVTGQGLGLPVGAQVVVGHAIAIAQCGSLVMPPMDFGPAVLARPS
jgi:hypothetical protein